MTLDPHSVARSLGGSVFGRNVVAPGPGHSRADRSLSIKLDPAAPDGFIVHSFAGDSPAECRAYVRAAIGLSPQERRRRHASARRSRPNTVGSDDHAADRSALALQLWNEARDARGTLVADYLASRGLTLPDDVANDVIRFHSALRFEGKLVGGMVALFRDIKTNKPCGIHRTFFDSEGCKLDRKMLGRARGAAIKLDADENVTLGLHVGEGVESSLAAWLAGFRPVWALGSAGGIAAFPALSGFEAITVLGETGDGGTNQRAAQGCAALWIEAGREAFLVTPQVGGDLNDVWGQVAP